MRRLRLLGLAALALFAFGAVAAATASAEDGQPAILLLEGNVTALQGTGTGGASRLVLLESGSTITGTSLTATVKGCKELEAKATDTNLCEGLIEFKGTKKEKVACRSETAGGVKDAVEVILVKLGLHLDAEETLPGKVLQPLLVSKVLSVDGTSPLIINCGAVKVRVLGSIGCLLLPGLKNVATTEKFEIVCEVDSKNDPVTGDCVATVQLCKEYKEDPFDDTIGTEFKDGWQEIKVTGSFNKDVFIDD